MEWQKVELMRMGMGAGTGMRMGMRMRMGPFNEKETVSEE